jgi:hypothetical protein
MSTIYEIHSCEEYWDEEHTVNGHPVLRRESSESSYESSRRPEVGDSWTFEEDGKRYRRTVISVYSNGYVHEDVESLDVMYSTVEI